MESNTTQPGEHSFDGDSVTVRTSGESGFFLLVGLHVLRY